ncbi:hypothetical protein PENSUB_9372 [Penicillium subrubescens]|uniref:Uncharacterized protein n=1 Tax=Penicillium subrubescens TaxID=1316194 RepID=A0A1Q5TDH4_9EURO|nr:hypothetical protein PENSUB_9372 [Penicillium subrubescens]
MSPGLLSSAGTGKRHQHHEQEGMSMSPRKDKHLSPDPHKVTKPSLESSRPIRAHTIHTRRRPPTASAGHRRKDGALQ